MFFCLPALKLNDGRIRINVLDQRVTGKTHNIDILHVSTKNEAGDTPQVTHFGIQGRSDHLAELMNKDDEESSDQLAEEPAASAEKKMAVAPVTDTPVSETEAVPA